MRDNTTVKDSRLEISRIRPRLLIITALLLAVIFFAIVLVGIRENESNMLRMLRREGGALIESILISSRNTIRATDLVDNLVTDNLVDAATLIDLDLGEGHITSERLNEICQLLGFNRIDIVDSSGIIQLSNFTGQIGRTYDSSFLQRLPLKDIIMGLAGVGSFVLSSTDISEMDQLVAAVSSDTRPGAVVIFMNYQKLDFFNRRIGLGYMIRNIGDQPGIVYIILQSRDGVMFSSRHIPPILSVDSDPFLDGVMKNEAEDIRRLMFDKFEVLEVCRPFNTENLPSGVMRLGLALDGFQQVSRNFRVQMAILGGILFLLTFLFVAITLANQNYRSVAVAYEQFKNITSNILGGIESAVIAVDSRNKIILVNPKTEKICGRKASEMIGRKYPEIFREDNFLINELLQSGQDSVIREIEIKNYRNETRILLATSSRLMDQDGNYQGGVGVAYDISERKKLESQAKQVQRLSELGTLAAGVAHEIRNPLNSIAIASQRLKSEFEVTEDREGYDRLTTTIKSEIERLNSIIVEFLALARSGQLHKVKVQIEDFLRDAVSLMRNEAEKAGIEIVTEIDGSIQANMDPAEMKKVLVNLIRNGMESIGQKGRIIVGAVLNDNRLRITVEDNGPGIDPSKINEIFTPYFTTKEQGTGLGLSISHRIVSDHQGSLGAENVTPHGARFVIDLPSD